MDTQCIFYTKLSYFRKHSEYWALKQEITMQQIRKAEQRGQANFGWLNSRHTFSFGSYYDQAHMGFGPLRVINEDHVAAGRGFDTHGHQDMEIISYVIAGTMAHKDSLGTGSQINPGEVQRMTAGTGVRHSEYNVSDIEPLHFLQIWILPEKNGLEPGYEQKSFADINKDNRLVLAGSRDGRNGSVTIHQDVDLYISTLQNNEPVSHPLAPGRKMWLQVVQGEVAVNDDRLTDGDGFALANTTDQIMPVKLQSTAADILLFDMTP
jgi:quercetin 2,3-dioxygenase